jgi:Ca2+-binding RTX toxin-like protein
MSFIANAQAGLVIDDASGGATTITAGTTGQTLTGGAGHDTLVGYTGGDTNFMDLAAAISGDMLKNFGANGSVIDLTNVSSASVTLGFVENGGGTAGVLTVSDGTHSASMTLQGSFTRSLFVTARDAGGNGTAITYS